MLPKIDLPIYEIALPSNGKKIKFRPYLVKEDRLLLMAAESKEPKDILMATKQVVQNCVLDPKNFDVELLSMVDFDFIFVNLRARSVGEELKVALTCTNKLPRIGADGEPQYPPCNTNFEITYNLDNVTIVQPPESATKKIMLDGSVGVEMRLPNFKLLEKLAEIDDPVERELKIIEGCMSKLFDREQSISLEKGDSTPAEIRAWIEGLTTSQFDKLKAFIENLPYLKLTFEGKCPNCEYMHKFEERKILDFF